MTVRVHVDVKRCRRLPVTVAPDWQPDVAVKVGRPIDLTARELAERLEMARDDRAAIGRERGRVRSHREDVGGTRHRRSTVYCVGIHEEVRHFLSIWYCD